MTGFTAVLLIGETILTKTSAGVSFLMNVIGLETLLDNSALRVLLGGDFISMAGTFLVLYTLAAFFAVFYVTRVLTKPPRIFF